MREVSIVGVGSTPFGKMSDRSIQGHLWALEGRTCVGAGDAGRAAGYEEAAPVFRARI